jgi:hypothetical protein
MTLAELAKETLVEKHRRLIQAKCQHEEVYSSTVAAPTGTFTNAFCLDCGKSWHTSKVPNGERQ